MTEIPKWDASFSVGNDKLDEQHQHLLELGAQVAKLLNHPSPLVKERFHTVINDYYVSTALHFRTEEELLRRHGYPEFSEHEKEHHSYLERLTVLLCDASDGHLNTSALYELVTHWIVEHMLTTDQRCKDYFVG